MQKTGAAAVTHDLTSLANNRDALLLAEVAAWLHMLGKFHEDFLQGQHDLDIQIPPDLTVSFAHLDNLLRDQSWSGAIWNRFTVSEFQAGSLSFYHFIEKHRTRNVAEGLLKLMWDAHGRGSGIEKGVLNRFALGQTTTVYSSTAFGTEIDAIDLNNLHDERHCLYDFLQTNLELLKNSLGSSAFNWQEFHRKFISNVEYYFRQTVAETRRPLSDVTLFDQTFASVAFLKAALAQNLLLGWKDPIKDIKNQDIRNIQDKYHWRLLRVGLDGLAFWVSSVRIGDLLARKELIGQALDEVQKVIEEEYPLGLQVYRDENGSVFIVPDVDKLLDATVKSGNSLYEHLQEIANRQFKGEACWTLELSNRTRNTLRFGRLATSLLNKPTANPEKIASYWNEKRDICPVCGLRPISNEKLKICNVCKDRRTSRAKEWNENLSTTIWIDEVADSNSRLALIVGRFELESWLTGEMLNSIVAFELKKRQLTDPDRNHKNYEFDYQTLLSDVQKTIKSNQFTNQAALLDNLVLKDARGGSFEQFYNLQVTDTDLGEGRITKEPFLLALAMMRQNPSFARLRRVWETTQRFWKEALADTQLPKVKGRLTIEATNLAEFRLQPFVNYDLVLGKTKLSILHNDDKLTTTDNLCYAAKQLGAKPEEYATDEAASNFIRQRLQNQQITIEEPTGYGSPDKLKGTLNISSVTPDKTEYSPVIPILAEPRTFMALVPADKSLEVIEAIKIKYEREMGKVRNRLPLHLGVVYFQRRTPLRSVLDAGRQMLSYKSPTDQQLWQVQSVDKGKLPNEKQELANGTKQFDETITLNLTQSDRTITWHVPIKMGDGSTDDNWYPYVFLKTSDDSEVNGRQRAIKSQRPGEITPCWLVHAGDLQEGDQIYFTPSSFDFEFLDSTARRFEIYYDEKTGRRPRRTRPFYLEDLERFDTLWDILKNLETSQRHQVIYAIEATRELWYGLDEKELEDEERMPDKPNKVFRQFVTDTLANAAWTKNYEKWTDIPPEQRQQLIDAGVQGELADLAELHMEILKER